MRGPMWSLARALCSVAAVLAFAPAHANSPPSISGTPPSTVAANANYAFMPAASDPDGDVLRFTLRNRPAWLSVDPTTGRLSGTPTSAQVGTYARLKLVVYDGAAYRSLPEFSITVTAATPATPPTASSTGATGLDFPSNGQGSVRFQFSGPHLVNFQPATYVWKLRPRQQSGYYTTLFWGPDGPFTGYGYYGPNAYPKSPPGGSTHAWAVSADGRHVTRDDHGRDTTVVKDRWYTQALTVRASGTRLVLQFYWDLDAGTDRVITYTADNYLRLPANPVLVFGDAPWNLNRELLSGVLRWISVYGATLSTADLAAEAASPGSTAAGVASVWYRNLNPTPDDISDKSGRGHHPAWVGAARPALWTDGSSPPPPSAPTLTLSANPTSVVAGAASTLSWSSTNATNCAASGAWSGAKATSGSQSTGALSAGTRTFTLACTGAGGSVSRSVTVTASAAPPPPPAPTLMLSANPASVAAGAASTLSWSSTDATNCTASGAWSGAKPTSGSQSTGALSGASTFTLACSGSGGSISRSVTVSVAASTPAPTVAISASPASVTSGASSNLTWSSTNATSCSASGAWSGAKPTAGSASTGALTNPSNLFTLACTGAGGTTSRSVTVTATSTTAATGLDFPSNGEGSVRFQFSGANLVNFYPATYIWKVRPRQQSGYYTTFFWGPDGQFLGYGYYGAHPYPKDPPGGSTHSWEVSIDGRDAVVDDNGNDTTVVKDRWYTQALVVRASGTSMIATFYWDLDTSTSRSITYTATNYLRLPPNPVLVFGDAPWQQNKELLSGVLRWINVYSTNLSPADIFAEAASPGSTAAGNASIWYRNLNPTPTDISDKSGKGHHPQWVTTRRPTLWTGP